MTLVMWIWIGVLLYCILFLYWRIQELECRLSDLNARLNEVLKEQGLMYVCDDPLDPLDVEPDPVSVKEYFTKLLGVPKGGET